MRMHSPIHNLSSSTLRGALCGIVENAYHAAAVDEHRQDYDVCLWNPQSKPGQTMEQRWFVGAHCDLPLRWMQDKASALGLGLTQVAVGSENYRGAFIDSYLGFLKGLYAKKIPRHYRFIGATQFGNEVMDQSVQQRRKTDLSYEPQNNGLPNLT